MKTRMYILTNVLFSYFSLERSAMVLTEVVMILQEVAVDEARMEPVGVGDLVPPD